MKTKLFVAAYLAATLPIAACTPGDDASFSSVRNTGTAMKSMYYSVEYDKDTCVQYFVSVHGGITARVSTDGTPRLEKICVEEMRNGGKA